MVSKLTLIHETTSRPLPFVDETIAQKFLSCPKLSNDSTETSETDDIRTLQDCFQRYFKPEILSGENSFDCYYCRSLDQTQSRSLLVESSQKNKMAIIFSRKSLDGSNASDRFLPTSSGAARLSQTISNGSCRKTPPCENIHFFVF